MWPVGIVIGVVAVVGLALDRTAPAAALLPDAAVPVLSALVSLLTPVGPGLFGAVLQVNSRGRVLLRVGAPGLHPVQQRGAARPARAGPGRRACAAGRSPWFDLALIGLAVLWAVYSLRTVPVAACMLAPLAAASAAAGSGRAPEGPAQRAVAGRGGAYRRRAGRPGGRRAADRRPAAAQTRRGWTPALGELPDGTKLVNDTLVRRLPHVALPAARPDDARLRRHLHRRRAASGTRRSTASQPGWVDLLRETDVELRRAATRLAPGLRPARAGGLDGRAAQRRTSSCSSRPPAGWPRASDATAGARRHPAVEGVPRGTAVDGLGRAGDARWRGSRRATPATRRTPPRRRPGRRRR